MNVDSPVHTSDSKLHRLQAQSVSQRKKAHLPRSWASQVPKSTISICPSAGARARDGIFRPAPPGRSLPHLALFLLLRHRWLAATTPPFPPFTTVAISLGTPCGLSWSRLGPLFPYEFRRRRIILCLSYRQRPAAYRPFIVAALPISPHWESSAPYSSHDC
jgi:hypothetical protein